MTTGSKIYILGAGSIGGLVGVELSALVLKPDVVLLLRNSVKVDHFKNTNKSTVFVKRLFKTPSEIISAKFEAQTSRDVKVPIENLIVTTKTYQTQQALQPYLPLITEDTNILLIQNGLGVAQELYKDVWPDIRTRPNLYQGVINHGAFVSPNTGDRYEISHSGFAPFFIGKIPKDLNSTSINNGEIFENIPLFIQQLRDAKGLDTTILSYTDLLISQIKKFTVNACINPVTSIIDCINGELQDVKSVKELFYDIVSESVETLLKLYPVLQEKDNIHEILNKKKLVEDVLHIGTVANQKNSSSMRQDCLNLRDTEIDYINGFIVKAAKELGGSAHVNETIANLVKLRLSLNRKRVERKQPC